jgi:hypothetical protein
MLGLTQPGRLLFNRPSFYEAASASAYAAAAWAFFFLWKYAETGALKWLTWFSFLLGLSLAGRPTLAFGAAAVIAAVIWKLRLSRPNRKTDHLFWKALLALGLPAAAVAALLGLYNLERFDSIWETGYRFQLTACGNKMTELTTLGQLPQRCLSNFFTYFFLPWGQSWPVSVWPLNWLPPLLPVTRYEALKGFFYCAPYGWMLLTLPLLWRHQSAKLQNLVGFTKVLALFSAVNLLFNISLGGITQRYAVEFGPMLCSLAVLALWWMEFARRKGQKVNLVMAPLLLLAVWSVGVNLFY